MNETLSRSEATDRPLPKQYSVQVRSVGTAPNPTGLKTLWSMTTGRAISAAQLQDCSKRSARNTRRYQM